MMQTILDGADATAASFRNANMTQSLMNHTNLELADFRGADLSQALLHAARETGTRYDGANVKTVRRTDMEKLEAEQWKPKR
jgi:uncharacterized protein YjbI with pentapeptide repeats